MHDLLIQPCGLFFLAAFIHLVAGPTTNLHRIGVASANPMETARGRTTVTALKDSDSPRLEMTCTMTRPTTSSIIAAVVKTVPRRVADKPLVLRIVKVVPRLVEQSAAPAAKACTGVAPTMISRTKERAMGKAIPVIATATERNRLAFREEKLVSRPPWLDVNSQMFEALTRITFVNKQDEP